MDNNCVQQFVPLTGCSLFGIHVCFSVDLSPMLLLGYYDAQFDTVGKNQGSGHNEAIVGIWERWLSKKYSVT